ncbi:MAG: hypothetical protein JXA22_10495 [Candidatus Thermoplasmatota archaeon]|nr:hypothetical protein [Candidatus Thermoplasmatota archaeon]
MSYDTARDMLVRAELMLADGYFLRAGSITKKANSLLDITQKMHRQFMDKLGDLLKRVKEMEDRGYDVSEARSLMDMARGKAMKSDYVKALEVFARIDPALDRATYLPFPLLNKTLEIISTIMYSAGKVNYTVRIENPTAGSLGEIIIRPFLSEGDFEPVPERYFGIIGPREFKESTFSLVPKVKDWSLGIGREVLMGEGVVLRTRLSSRGGKAKYFVTIENNSDQIIRDIRISPMAPGGLGSEPASGTMDLVEPFAQKTLEFDLFPLVLEKNDTVEKVIAVEGSGTSGLAPPEEDEVEEDWLIEDEEETPAEPDLDLDGLDEEELPDGPRDFTPIEEEYNLISMVPLRYPEKIEREIGDRKKKVTIQR